MVDIVKKNWIIFLIFILALFLRIYRLDYLELFGDELDAGYQSYSLLTTGRDYRGNLLPTYIHSFSEWRAPGLMYVMMPFISIFGLDEWGVRVGPVVFGVLSILGFYLLLLKINVSKNICLISAFLLAVTPWHIQYSRSGFEITLLSCLLIFGLYFLIIKRFFISAILLGFSLYTYSIANILMPLLIVLTLYFYKINFKNFFRFVLIGLFFSLPIVYQLFFGHVGDRFGTLNILTNKDVVAEVNDYRNGSGNTFISKIFYNKYTISIKKILFNYSNAFGSNFLFNEGDVTFRHSLHQVGNLFWVELPLVLWGIIQIIKRRKYFWIMGFLLIAPLASSLTIDGYNHATRLFLMVFPLSFLAAYGLANIKKFKLFFILMLLFEFSRFQYYYWNFYRNQSWRWWHTGYKESMQYISENKDKYEKVVMDNSYEPALIRFLFWNKIDSEKVFELDDSRDYFCINSRFCFSRNLKKEGLGKGILYLISEERSGGKDWGEVLKTVYNYQNSPIFYLVSEK